MLKNVFPLLLLLLPLASGAQQTHPTEKWIGTWASSPMGEAVNSGQVSPADSTYRDVVRISAGGPQIRVVLTNEFGAHPLAIGAAHVALSAAPDSGSGGAIEPGSDHVLTFAGQSSIVIPNGALAVSDPVPMQVAPLSSLAVSVYLPEQPISNTTCHEDGQSTNFITPGDTTAAATLSDARHIFSWCFMKGIQVSASDPRAASIVAFGDSITDGWQSTRDANRRWPDVLASRLAADPKLAHLSVLNEGIGGNRLLHDGAGPNALARFDRDVLSQDGVRYVIVLEGINDIGHTAQPRDPSDVITTPELIFALSQIVARAHAHGIKVYGATLTPYIGAKYASAAGEQMREAENEWIRSSGVFDGVIDFDKITRDPNNPKMFAPAYDSGDHLHPNDAGYAAMGNAIDLSLFR